MTSISRTLARLGTLATAFALGVQHALAQVPAGVIPSAPENSVGSGGNIDIKDIIAFAATYLLSIAGGLAVLFLVVGGIIYTTAGGSDEKVAKAKKYMMNAIVGLVVVLLAFVIVGNTLKVTYSLNSKGTASNSTPVRIGQPTTAGVTCTGICGAPTSTNPNVATATLSGNTVTITGVAAGSATIGIVNGTPSAIPVVVQ